jgi:hypothetical protein
LLVIIWLAPIICLLVLPKRQSELIYDIAPDEDNDDDDDEEDEHRNNSNHYQNQCNNLQATESLEHEVAQVVDTSNDTTTSPSRTCKDKKGATVTLRRQASIPRQEQVSLLAAAPHGNNSNNNLDGSISSGSSRSRAGAVPREHERDRRLLEEDDDDIDHHYEANINVNANVGDRNLVQMLQTPSAWLMLWTTTILVGAGTVETNNMGQMVEALGFDKAVTPASLALFSVAQAFSRVMTGTISESALNWNTRCCLIDNGVPRPFFLVLASLLGCCAHFMLGMAVDQSVFVIGSLLAGAAFGMVWPLLVLVVGEVWGKNHMGANYMFFDGFTSAIGTLLLSKIIAQDIYESHTDPHADDPNACYGTACFRQTHMIVAGLSLSCVLTSVGLMYASRHAYNRSGIHLSA